MVVGGGDETSDQEANDGGTEDKHYSLPPIQLTVDWYRRPDPVLQDLVGIANIGPGVGVTLYLPWGIASGFVEAGDNFFADAAAKLRDEAARREEDEEMRGVIEAVASRSFDPFAEHMAEADRMVMNTQQGFDVTSFIHLSNVETFMHSWNTWQTHEHLRVRLGDVTSWAYGMLRGSAS